MSATAPPPPAPPAEICFDDVEGLRAFVTDQPGPFGPQVVVTQQMIDAFADLTGDRQWIHVDVDRARRESPFGGPIAHGFLILSLLPRLFPLPVHRIVGYGSVANYGASGLRFLAPVPAGAAIHARSRYAAVEARPKGTLLTVETLVHVVGADDRSALSYSGLLLYQPRKVT